MLKVALTGNVGAGKTEVSRIFEEKGARVVDTDVVAREIVEPGSPALARIREIWGDQVIDEDGQLDRAALRRLVFADPGARRDLEMITHPAILERVEALMAEAEADGAEVFVAVVPLLYETGLDAQFDYVVLVDSPLERRIQRIVGSRDVTEEEARRIAASQMPAEEKREVADLVIVNDSELEALEARANQAWNAIRQRAAVG